MRKPNAPPWQKGQSGNPNRATGYPDQPTVNDVRRFLWRYVRGRKSVKTPVVMGCKALLESLTPKGLAELPALPKPDPEPDKEATPQPPAAPPSLRDRLNA